MESIRKVSELILHLKNAVPEDFPKILKALKIPSKEFEPFMSWKPNGYSRNCIRREAHFELVLLCWNPGNATPIHSHSGQKCWVYQVSGKISEKRFLRQDSGDPREISTKALYPGTLTYMEDRMGYHVLENDSGLAATTLHLYMSPIDSCEYFCKDEAVFKEKKLAYDTIHH